MNTSAWKEFHLYDVFDISMGNKMDRGKMSDGDIAFIGRTANNNGINARVGMVVNHEKYGSVKPYSGNCLTLALGGSIGSCFYQEEPFYTSQNVVVLIPRDEQSKESLIFAATAISYCVNNGKYGAFSEELNKHIKTDFVFNLPATPDGHPDWNYMEQYMHSVMENCEKKYQILVRISQEKHQVDTTAWGEFRVGDVFDIVPCKGVNSTLLEDGDDVPYIAASRVNNGFNRMVSAVNVESWISKGNCLQLIHIGDAAAGWVNYIQNDFIGMSGKSSCAYNERMNEYSGTFIASVLCARNEGQYSFKESWTGEKVVNTVIKLPITSSGEPDWDYMEQYMKRIMQRQSVVVEALRKIA